MEEPTGSIQLTAEEQEELIATGNIDLVSGLTAHGGGDQDPHGNWAIDVHLDRIEKATHPRVILDEGYKIAELLGERANEVGPEHRREYDSAKEQLDYQLSQLRRSIEDEPPSDRSAASRLADAAKVGIEGYLNTLVWVLTAGQAKVKFGNATGVISLEYVQPGITEFHLPGKHDQENHGHPGPGEIAEAEERAKKERKAGEPEDETTQHILEGAKDKALLHAGKKPATGSKAEKALMAEHKAKDDEFHKNIDKHLDDKFGEGTAKRIRDAGQNPADYYKRGASPNDFKGWQGELEASAKPFPGTDSWLAVHGIDRESYNARPMKRATGPNDPVVDEMYKEWSAKDKNFAKKSLSQAEGIIMARQPYPGAEEDGFGKIVPQFRPDSPVIVNGQDRGKKESAMKRAELYKEQVDGWTEKDIIADRQKKYNEARRTLRAVQAGKYSPEDLSSNENRREDKASASFKKAIDSHGDPKLKATYADFEAKRKAMQKQGSPFEKGISAEEKEKRIAAKKEFTKVESKLNKQIKDTDDPDLFAKKQEYNIAHREGVAARALSKTAKSDYKLALGRAEQEVAQRKESLDRAKADPAAALDGTREFAAEFAKQKRNAYDKTKVKYAFPPGTGSAARIEVNQDPTNIKNLTKGKGKVYFIMEGNIKADAALSAIKREDPTAAVVSVPSVTLWRTPGEAEKFAKRHLQGRDVVLVPDADGAFNDNVMSQAIQLRGHLLGSGAKNVFMAAPPTIVVNKRGDRATDALKLPTADPKTKRLFHDYPDKDPDGFDGRKGLDDHLGLGKGTLGDLVYSDTKAPNFDITHLGQEGKKLPRPQAVRNLNRMMNAISDIAGQKGIGRISQGAISAYSQVPDTTVNDNFKHLENLGLIKVHHIFDPGALRNHRVRYAMPFEDVKKLVKRAKVPFPALEEGYLDKDLFHEVSPIIEILDDRYITKRGPEKRLASRFKNLKTSAASRIVRTPEGAALYGVPIGSEIPVGQPLPSTVLSMTMVEQIVPTGFVQLSFEEE